MLMAIDVNANKKINKKKTKGNSFIVGIVMKIPRFNFVGIYIIKNLIKINLFNNIVRYWSFAKIFRRTS